MQSILDTLFADGLVKISGMSDDDLNWLREIINNNYRNRLLECHPEFKNQLNDLYISNYHLIRHLVNHEELWMKKYRLFDHLQVYELAQRDFFNNLKNIFGDFNIADQTYNGEMYEGQEEIYWRLVCPGITSDVGSIHADRWFHELHKLNSFNDNSIYKTLKAWIPIYCQSNQNGLSGAIGSHKFTNKYRSELRNNIPYPVYESNTSHDINFNLIPTNPGDILLFGDNFLHGGSLNLGNETRVSIEITLRFSFFNPVTKYF